jgi:hypothetical protein
MATVDKVFAGSIPAIYDQFLVPLIFEEAAERLAEQVAGAAPARILETAAGAPPAGRCPAGGNRPQPADARPRRRAAGGRFAHHLAAGRRLGSAV